MVISKKIAVGLVLSLIFISAEAQTLNLEEGECHWEGGFSAGLNNDGYEFDFRVAYFPIPYIGVKAGIGLAGEIWELEDWVDDYNDEAYYEYAARFKFNPAIVIRSPRLINWKSQDAGFYLFTEPGIVLSPGARGSRNAQHYRWDVKSGVNLQFDRFIVTIGYGISNFSLYSGAPITHWGLPENMNYITHTVFIGGAVKF